MLTWGRKPVQLLEVQTLHEVRNRESFEVSPELGNIGCTFLSKASGMETRA
jgi:hypothetical protein